jgi:carboxypeptidase C (cathepsin A)
VFPARVWRQDPATRHQKIVQAIKAPHVYPFADGILNNAINWTAHTTQLFDAYVEDTRLELEQVYELSKDYMDVVMKNAQVPEVLLHSSSDTLEESIKHYLNTNKRNLTLLIQASNNEFNSIINLSGPLRRPLESIRFDIMQSIKEAKDTQIRHIEIALTNLASHAQNELKNPSISIDLKDYIVKPIRDELASFYKTSNILDHLKQRVSWILNMGSNEFRYNPSQLGFWMDLLEEMKDADIRWLQSLSTKFPSKKQASCAVQQ